MGHHHQAILCEDAGIGLDAPRTVGHRNQHKWRYPGTCKELLMIQDTGEESTEPSSDPQTPEPIAS